MFKIMLKVEKPAPIKARKFDMKFHKKRLIELKPRRIRHPRPQDHNGHGNIRYSVGE